MAMNLLSPIAGAWDVTYRLIAEKVNALVGIVGNIFTGYESTFQSGQVVYGGPNGSLQTNANFRFGLNLPNASGINSIALMLGGAGQVQVVYLTDEQLPGQKGITVIREAGDASATAPATNDGGDLLDFAGGTLNGTGGTAKYQGGTSVNGTGGPAILHGGNSTNGSPGPAIVQAGETGTQPGNCLYIATKPPGASSYGVHRFDFNSNPTFEFHDLGQFFIYTDPSGPTYGLAGQPLVSGGSAGSLHYLTTGFTGTITTAKLTAGGTNGSMTFASGLLTGQTQAT